MLDLLPLVRSFRGVLPIELSLRGARYEEVDATSEALDALANRVTNTEEQSEELSQLLAGALETLASFEAGVSPAVGREVEDPESKP